MRVAMTLFCIERGDLWEFLQFLGVHLGNSFRMGAKKPDRGGSIYGEGEVVVGGINQHNTVLKSELCLRTPGAFFLDL